MPSFGKLFIILLTATAVTAGCSGRVGQDIPAVTTLKAEAAPVEAPSPTPVKPPDSPLKAPTMNKLPLKGSEIALAAAIADLVKQTGAAPNDISLVSMEAKEWSDASLGCPQEGMMYAQVITPGYLLVLAAQGKQYEYHTDAKTTVVWCKK